MNGPLFLADGRIVYLEWTFSAEMVAWTTGADRERIGSISFKLIEGDRSDGFDDRYLVTSMSMDGPDGMRAYQRRALRRKS